MQQPQKTLTLLRLQAPFRGSASSCCSRPSMLVLKKKNSNEPSDREGEEIKSLSLQGLCFFKGNCTSIFYATQTQPKSLFTNCPPMSCCHSSVTKENQLPFPAVLRFLNKLPMDSLRFIPGALACKVSWQGLGMDSVVDQGFWPMRPHIETEHPSTSARRAWGVPLGCEELVAWSPVGFHHFWQCCWLQLKQMWTTVEVRPFQWNRWSSLWKTQNCWVLYRFSNCGQVHRFWSYIKPRNQNQTKPNQQIHLKPTNSTKEATNVSHLKHHNTEFQAAEVRTAATTGLTWRSSQVSNWLLPKMCYECFLVKSYHIFKVFDSKDRWKIFRRYIRINLRKAQTPNHTEPLSSKGPPRKKRVVTWLPPSDGDSGGDDGVEALGILQPTSIPLDISSMCVWFTRKKETW